VRRRRGGPTLLAAGLASLALSCAPGDDGPRPVIEPLGGEAPTGLLVITMDTTRADRIGTYGYRDARTPHLDRLAERGVVFERAVTSTPLTVPAHASLFTGWQPPYHGVRTNEGVLLDPPNLTLAEMLRDRGFRTGAFIGAAVLRGWTGLDQGFDDYGDDLPHAQGPGQAEMAERPAGKVVAQATAWLAGVGEQPYFLWVHLFDPHGPYRPPGDFARDFADRPYDGEVAYGDEQIGVLLEAVERLGLRDRTLVAFLSDHGEGLGDNGEITHGFFLYESTVRIPFILSCPSVLPQGLRQPSLVEIIDFVPTALALLDVEAIPALGGRNLLPYLGGEAAGETAAYGETHYPLVTHGWSPIYSLRRGGYKIVRAPAPELYDLERDPAESENLYEQRREVGDAMLAELAELERSISREAPAADLPIDSERRRVLESLGYVVSAGPPPAEALSLPDPKSRLQTIYDLGKVRRFLSENRYPEALTLLQEVESREPQSRNVLELMGSTYLSVRKFQDAGRAYTRLLELDPENLAALTNLGMLAVAVRNAPAALSYLERARAVSPDDPLVLLNLGQIRFRVLGEKEEGRPLLERFLEVAPDDPAAPMVRGLLAANRD